ncbi:MAG: hypothetical protein ACLSGB_06180 [Dorea sp.]
MSAGNEKVYVQFLASENQSLSALAASRRYGNFIRWDWYKEAGSPEIQSVDDFLNLLKTIQTNHPETESVRKHMVFPDLMTGD